MSYSPLQSTIEHDFRRVESVLIDVANDPNNIHVIGTPSNITSNTYAKRIRIGVKNWLAHRWSSPLLNLQFATLWPGLVVSAASTHVKIGPRALLVKNSFDHIDNNNHASTKGGVVWIKAPSPTPDDITLLLQLHHRGYMREATQFSNMTDEQASILHERIEDEQLNVTLAKYDGFDGYILL